MKAATVQAEIGGRVLTIETGRMARQADGSAVVRHGENVVLVAATCGPDKDLPFFPLTVDYREKPSSAGKIPGGFFKREGRPTTKEILTMRLIDRPVRPLFPKGFRREIQIMGNVLSADPAYDPDILAMNAASTALTISRIPFNGPIASVRIGLVGGDFVIDPSYEVAEKGELDLVLSGTRDALLMVEASAREVPEGMILDAFEYGHEVIRKLIDLQLELAAQVGVTKDEFEERGTPEGLFEKLEKQTFAQVYEKIHTTAGKRARSEALAEIFDEVREDLVATSEEEIAAGKYPELDFAAAAEEIERRALRKIVTEREVRIDARQLDEIREISCELSMLPRSHGSALFTRGETQAIVTTTLGSRMDEQKIDGLKKEHWKRFMLHYNFPPFCVGETRPIRGPGRREIGHGMLAERALAAVLPSYDDFPYTIRLVSDILESNGSSSMASVCGGTLALMDAGVPINKPVAGIAMGLIKEVDQFRVLSDILGDEDHHGDMDFKVAGTQRGITALQMDSKIGGIPREVMSRALEQARKGRLEILKKMLAVLDRPRAEISRHAPRVVRFRVNPDKISLIIGTGGRTIKKIQEDTGAKVEVTDDGWVAVYCAQQKGADDAANRIQAMTEEVKVGKLYLGRVTSIKPFGAFIEVLPGQEGLVHVSELTDGYVNSVQDVLMEGDETWVKVLAVDDQGRLKLSKKAADRHRAERGERVESNGHEEPDGELAHQSVPDAEGGEGAFGDQPARPRRPPQGRGRGGDRGRRGPRREGPGDRPGGGRPRH